MKRFLLVICVFILVSGITACNKPSTDKYFFSCDKVEYLMPSDSSIPYAKQWTYGSWRPVGVISEGEAGKQLATNKLKPNQIFGHQGQWIYGCDSQFSWNKPPIIKAEQLSATPGTSIPPARLDAIYPSIYRYFFGVEKLSSGTLYISVSGSVDVYMDPPVGTALVTSPPNMSKSYIGRSTTLNQVAINLDKIHPGTHCLYFVHRANDTIPFFGMRFFLGIAAKASQTSDCLWPISEGGCQCTASNGTTEFLEADNDWNNIGDSRYPAGMTPAGTPFGTEWVYGAWSPATVIPYAAADNFWGRAVGGSPWRKQLSQGACWVTHKPHMIPGHPTWGREIPWRDVPTGYTSIFRHTFSVDKQGSASLFIFTNDIVDVYFDPVEPDPARWFAATLVEWQGPLPLAMNNPWKNQPSYYYVGRADKQTRGMKIDLANLVTPGTHTLYFVHRNSSEVKPIPSRDYYGMLFSLCMKEECQCPEGREPKKK